MVEQDPFLQRGERIDVLHIGDAAGSAPHDQIDLLLVKPRQWHHVRRDLYGSQSQYQCAACL